MNTQLKMMQLNEAAAQLAECLATSEAAITNKINEVQADIDDANMQIADLSVQMDDIVAQSQAIIDDLAAGNDGSGAGTPKGLGVFRGLIGDGVLTTIYIVHSLNEPFPVVQFYDVITAKRVMVDYAAITPGTIQAIFIDPPAPNSIEVVVMA